MAFRLVMESVRLPYAAPASAIKVMAGTGDLDGFRLVFVEA
jgi:hypothetical protein